ncbi:MAG: polysaccharide biosynthesis protein [Thermotogae bacterium]|jgi:UDP-glucose 4-epimerase|nr:polysaccharide biosynthesis protein [Thermotogota bacterium]
MFKDKILLVTGGTGSFGNAVVNRFLKEDVKEIRIFSRDEKKQDDMRNFYKDDRLKFYIGDVRDFNSIELTMRGVNYVFNAAALKQVPSCEFFPIEAVKTNILGAENVLNAAILNKVEKVVILSTDKAVYPINAMGMTKALMEKVMVAKARTNTNGTLLCGTRYGNVMASRGSVIPLFIDQIKHGQPLTVTNPNMTRFMMTLDDAINLVLYAFEHGNPGDIFVQKAPAGTIGDLAKAIKELFNANNEVKIIGTRHGEKLYETLLTSEEMAVAQDLENYYCIPMDGRDLNYGKYLNQGEIRKDNVEPYTSHNTKRLNLEELKQLLLKVDLVKAELKNWEQSHEASLSNRQ